MAKKKKMTRTARKKTFERKAIPDTLLSKLTPLTLSSRNGECSVEFNKYIVVYSNNVVGNLSSSWRAGETSIGCYKDQQFVGSIVFYETHENMNGGYVDPNGVIVMEFPIDRFEDVMRILKTFSNLYLLFVERDQQGVPLAHPVGAIMTFAGKLIGT
jgi:hypothetical protein